MKSHMQEAKRMGWFSRLFGPRAAPDSALEATIGQVIDGVDPRLRLVKAYARRLRPAVDRVSAYFNELTARIPAAVEFSERDWSTNPLLRFLFADVAQMRRVFSTSGELREFFRAHPEASEVFVGLGLTRHEQRMPGKALVGEVVQSEVVQTSIGFVERLVVGASADEAELRARLKMRCLNFLIAEVLGQLARQGPNPGDLETEDNLKLWLRAREHARCAVEGLFGSTDALDREIAALRERLARRGRFAVAPPSGVMTLDEQLDRTCAALESVPRTITLDIVRLRVDHANIRLDPDAREGADVAFAEASIGSLPPRAVVLARVPRDQLLPEDALLENARRLLG